MSRVFCSAGPARTRGAVVAILLLFTGRLPSLQAATEADSASLKTQLLEACQNFDAPVMAALVQQGVPATMCDASGQTPLMLVAGRADLVRILLAAKPDLDVRGPDGATALYLACAADSQAGTRELVEAGADPNIPVRSTSRTPLLAAIENNDPALAILLVRHQADPNRGFSGGTPIACAVAREQVDVAAALLAAGAREDLPNVDAAGHHLMTLVAKAAVDGNTAMMDLLLAHGGTIGETDRTGGTPLLMALLRGQPASIDYLLAKGADVNHSDNKGESPLEVALLCQPPSVWQEILDHGARIDAVNRQGQNALMVLASVGASKAVRFLLDHGANVNLVDARGETALTYAGDRGMNEIVDWLKDAGATRTDVHLIPKPQAVPPLSAACRWELALSAPFDQLDGGNPNLLGAGNHRIRAQHLLEHDWPGQDRSQLLAVIHRLIDPGERAKFQAVGELAAQNNPVLNYLPDHWSRRDRTFIMGQCYRTWGDRAGLAWDIARAVHAVNLAVALGYISDKEAWPLLDEAATQVQSRFGSWKEYGSNFLDSREMAMGVADPSFELAGQLLTDDPNSPWNQIPWDTPLGLDSTPTELPAPAPPAPEPPPPKDQAGGGFD